MRNVRTEHPVSDKTIEKKKVIWICNLIRLFNNEAFFWDLWKYWPECDFVILKIILVQRSKGIDGDHEDEKWCKIWLISKKFKN